MIERKFGRIVNITSSAVKAPIDILGLSNGARSRPDRLRRGPRAQGRAAQRHDQQPAARAVRHRSPAHDARGPREGGRQVVTTRCATRAMNATPAGRFGDPREFGAICAFLCSVHAGYIAGQNILADGGAYPGTF